jgi:hypothetical protein
MVHAAACAGQLLLSFQDKLSARDRDPYMCANSTLWHPLVVVPVLPLSISCASSWRWVVDITTAGKQAMPGGVQYCVKVVDTQPVACVWLVGSVVCVGFELISRAPARLVVLQH